MELVLLFETLKQERVLQFYETDDLIRRQVDAREVLDFILNEAVELEDILGVDQIDSCRSFLEVLLETRLADDDASKDTEV